MSAIHYKFSSSNEYKNVTFDGLNLSLHDLKKLIMEKQKLKSTELDLHITNAQTLQVYKDESVLIPKNTAVLVRRIPLGPIRDSKVYIVKRNETAISTPTATTKNYQETESTPKLSLEELKKTSNLAEANASEEDKIKAAIAQSTNEYDPSNFVKPPRYGSYKYSAPTSTPISQMRCYRCNQQGHYTGQCPMPKADIPKLHHHATGIPRSHMIEVNKDSKGAMLTSDGRYVVPVMDKKGYDFGKKERPPFLPVPVAPTQEDDEEEPIPDELICLLCKDLLVDAVVIPCCGNSYCDDCIRNALLESENHQCPTCQRPNISPDSLIANKFLRQAVNKFRNDTGIAKKKSNAPVWPRPAPSEVNKVKQVQPAKVTYGPPRSTPISDLGSLISSSYIVKASTDQIVASKAYTISKRTPETGGGSPRDPNQPIRIKIGKQDKVEVPVVSSVQSTPSEVQMQSTPAENSTHSSTASDSYTFNSTPDSNDLKLKVSVAEPLPPGISPPVARVVRPLVDEQSAVSEGKEPPNLSGIEPLADSSTNPDEQQPDKEADSVHIPVDSYSAEPEAKEESENLPITAPPQAPIETSDPAPPGEAQDAVPPASFPPQPLQNSELLSQAVDSRNDESHSQPELEVSEISSSDVDMSSLQLPPVQETLVVHAPQVRSSVPLNITSTIPPPSISVPPPSIAVQQAPAVARHLPSHMIPPVLPGMPPIPPVVSGTSVFQHPPPPFPPMFPPLHIRPGQFTQPPPGFPLPPHPSVIPPLSTAMAIPSLGKTTTAALPPPPGTTPTLLVNNTSLDAHTSLRDRNERSPRKRTDHHHHHRGSKSKLDIMSDEFAEKLKKRPERQRRERSRSFSSSSSSSSSSRSSSSYSSSSSSYSSSASSWSDSSYSRSRTPSPRKKKHSKRSKRRSSKSRKKRSSSWSDRSQSRERTRGKRKEQRKRRGRTPPKRKKRDNRSRSYSPRRRSNRDRNQRSPHRSNRGPPSPKHKLPEPPTSRPQIPVISRGIPGLPSKEQADFERDQALYAHFRHAYERDWYERGIRPPPPYDQFINARVSKSPSPPPGTGVPPHPTSIPGGFPPGYPLPPAPQGHPVQGLQLPSLLSIRVPPPISTPGIPPSHSAPPQWDEKRYPPHSRSDPLRPPPNRDYFPHQGGPPGYQDYSSRSRHEEYDSKEERYRMQLSPRSRRRFDMDHPPRDSRYRDGRYGPPPRRTYDDYQARKRAREQQRELSPRGSQSRNKRSRPSPDVEDDGDATPVRDERPPPEERHLEEQRPVTRRAGDISKVGKKPRRERKDSDHSRSRRSSSPGRKDAKSSSSRSRRSRSKTSKRKAESRDSSSKSKSESKSKKKDFERSETQEKKSRKEESKSDKKEASSERKSKKTEEKESKSEKRKRKDESKTEEKPKVDTKSEKEDKYEEQPKDPAVKKEKDKQEHTPKIENDVKVEENPPQVEEKMDDESSVHSEKVEDLPDPVVDSQKPPQKEDKTPKDAVPTPAKTESPAPTTQAEGKEKVTARKTKEKKKEKPGKVKLVRKGPAADQTKKDAKSAKVKKSEAKNTSSKTASEKTGTDKTASEKVKLVEYDGSGPPPVGNELVKITIPKSKWEESDDEGKAKTSVAPEKKEGVTTSRRVVKTSDVKPTKGRRIRIKRKSPIVAPSKEEEVLRKVESASETPKSAVHSTVKKLSAAPAKEVISDARMVITLRRNSKNQEERKRRVSMGNPDESHFEPDYDDMTLPEKDLEKGGKPKSVGILRSESQDSRRDDPDALAISDYSGFTDDEEQEKIKKKKKKKRKKHKHKSQSSDVDESESRKKRSYDQDDDISPVEDDQKYQRRRDSKDHKRHRKGSSAEERLKKKEKKKRRDESRNHDRDSPTQSYDRGEKSREKKRKKEKKQKHRRRRESNSYASDN